MGHEAGPLAGMGARMLKQGLLARMVCRQRLLLLRPMCMCKLSRTVHIVRMQVDGAAWWPR